MKNILLLLALLLLTSCSEISTLGSDVDKSFRFTLNDGTTIITKKFTNKSVGVHNNYYLCIDNRINESVKISKELVHRIDTITSVNGKLILVDSSQYYDGYRQGQIDSKNGKEVWKLVQQDNGEIIYQKVEK